MSILENKYNYQVMS